MHLLGIGYDCMHTTHEWKFGIIFFYSNKIFEEVNYFMVTLKE